MALESRRPTSGWAVAAVIVGLLGCVPLGVVFGLVALVKTRAGTQRGRGLAVAALVLSAVWVGGYVVAFDVFKLGDSLIYRGRLGAGECVDQASPHVARESMQIVGCDNPHGGEVFQATSMSSFDDHVSEAEKEKRCRAALSAYAPAAARDSSVGILAENPSTEDWKEGDHRWLCIATFDPARTGSIKAQH